MGMLDWVKDKIWGSPEGAPTLERRKPLQLWICRCGNRYSGGSVCPNCKVDNSRERTVDDPAPRNFTIVIQGVILTVVVISGVATVIWLGGLLGTGATATAVGIGLVGTGTATAGTGKDAGSGKDNSTGTNPQPPNPPLPDGPRSYHLYQGKVSWRGPVVVTNHDFGGSDILLVFEVAGNIAEFREAQIIIAGGGQMKVGERFSPVDNGNWYNWSNRMSMKPAFKNPVDLRTTSVAGNLDSHAQNSPQYAFQATRVRVLNSDEYSSGEGDVYRGIVNAAYAAKPARPSNLPERQERPPGKPMVPQF